MLGVQIGSKFTASCLWRVVWRSLVVGFGDDGAAGSLLIEADTMEDLGGRVAAELARRGVLMPVADVSDMKGRKVARFEFVSATNTTGGAIHPGSGGKEKKL
jgi:hypothetical protein